MIEVLQAELDMIQLAHQESITEQQMSHDGHAEKIAARSVQLNDEVSSLKTQLGRSQRDVRALESELRRVRTNLDQTLASWSWRFGHGFVRAFKAPVRLLSRMTGS